MEKRQTSVKSVQSVRIANDWNHLIRGGGELSMRSAVLLNNNCVYMCLCLCLCASGSSDFE